MMLEELIAYLEKKDPPIVLPNGFFHPHSYRGFYEQLAFEPKQDVRVGDMLLDARSALGATFEGYKGGSFKMREYTDCWLAQYGNSGDSLNVLVLDAMFLAASHAALVEALEQCESALSAALTLVPSTSVDDEMQSALDMARNALSQAGVSGE